MKHLWGPRLIKRRHQLVQDQRSLQGFSAQQPELRNSYIKALLFIVIIYSPVGATATELAPDQSPLKDFGRIPASIIDHQQVCGLEPVLTAVPVSGPCGRFCFRPPAVCSDSSSGTHRHI